MATRPQTTPTHVPRDMDKWTYVFVRNDAVRGPLNSPYLEPFKILSRAKKHFKLDMNDRTEIVSVDRLKKAHFECDVTDLDVVDTPIFNPYIHLIHSPLYKTNQEGAVHLPTTKTDQDSFYLI